MKVLRFLRDIILMLYICIFILIIICYGFGISAVAVTSPNEFSNVEMGSLILFKHEEFFGALPWFGYALTWIKTIPGIIISSLFTILIFGTFIFEIIRDKNKKKLDSDTEDFEDELIEEDIEKANKFFSNNEQHIEDERLTAEFDEQRLAELNKVFEDSESSNETHDEEEINEEKIEETFEEEDIENNSIEEVIEEPIEDTIKNEIENNEEVVDNKEVSIEETDEVENKEQSITDRKDDEAMSRRFKEENGLNFDESILDKYFEEDTPSIENQYLDTKPLPDELIENIGKGIEDKVYEAKHGISELSQIPDSINRDTETFEELLTEVEKDDNEYHQMSLADLEDFKDDPVIKNMDFSESSIPEESTISKEVVNDLKKELTLKTEEINILRDKLTSMENIDLAEVDNKLKAVEKEKTDLQNKLNSAVKENSSKDEIIAELNENLSISNNYVKDIENALNTAINERDTLKSQLQEYSNTVSKYDEVISESNDKMDKYIDKYNLMYERYISTIEYLVKKGLANEDAIDREKDTFDLNK